MRKLLINFDEISIISENLILSKIFNLTYPTKKTLQINVIFIIKQTILI